MKKLVLTLFTVAFAAGSTFAQADKALVEAQKKAILEAVKKSDDEAKKVPTKAKTWLTRAQAYLDLASFPDSTLALTDADAAFKALDYINEAIKLDTKDGKKGGTAKEAEKLIEDKKVYSALMNMGVIKYQGKDFGKSFKYMSKASELSPKDTTSAMYTGVVAQLSQKDAEAKVAYEHYMSIGGKDIAIIYGLAQIYKTEKQEDKSLALLDEGIKIYPTNKDLKNEKFNTLIAFNRIDLAIIQLNKTIAADPKDAMSLVNLGLLYENKMSGMKDEMTKIQDKSFKVEDAKRKMASQKDQVDVYLDEVKRTKAKLKTAQPKQKAAIQAQITKFEATVAEQNKALDELKAELTKQEALVGDMAQNKDKIDELTAKVKVIRDDVPQYYTRALAIDPVYYDALYQLGALNYNDAAEFKKQVNAMDMETYKKEGKNVEAKFLAKYSEALPFFEKAYSVKKDEDLKEILKQLYRELKLETKLAELEK
jgi:tetratricopeptide (TPR) repeat protein